VGKIKKQKAMNQVSETVSYLSIHRKFMTR